MAKSNNFSILKSVRNGWNQNPNSLEPNSGPVEFSDRNIQFLSYLECCKEGTAVS